jgi:hypothetical protein
VRVVVFVIESRRESSIATGLISVEGPGQTFRAAPVGRCHERHGPGISSAHIDSFTFVGVESMVPWRH